MAAATAPAEAPTSSTKRPLEECGDDKAQYIKRIKQLKSERNELRRQVMEKDKRLRQANAELDSMIDELESVQQELDTAQADLLQAKIDVLGAKAEVVGAKNEVFEARSQADAWRRRAENLEAALRRQQQQQQGHQQGHHQQQGGEAGHGSGGASDHAVGPEPMAEPPELSASSITVAELKKFIREAGAAHEMRGCYEKSELLALARQKVNAWEVRRLVRCSAMRPVTAGYEAAVPRARAGGPAALTRAIRALARRVHPDKCPGDPLATEAFQYLQAVHAHYALYTLPGRTFR